MLQHLDLYQAHLEPLVPFTYDVGQESLVDAGRRVKFFVKPGQVHPQMLASECLALP